MGSSVKDGRRKGYDAGQSRRRYVQCFDTYGIELRLTEVVTKFEKILTV